MRNVALVIVCAAFLAACAPSWPSANWSGSSGLSKSQVLRFVAAANCTVPWPFNPIDGDFFYQVSSLRQVPGERWLYEIQYRDATRVISRVVYTIQWWTAAKTVAAPQPSYDADRNCVVIIEVPEAKSRRSPVLCAGCAGRDGRA